MLLCLLPAYCNKPAFYVERAYLDCYVLSFSNFQMPINNSIRGQNLIFDAYTVFKQPWTEGGTTSASPSVRLSPSAWKEKNLAKKVTPPSTFNWVSFFHSSSPLPSPVLFACVEPEDWCLKVAQVSWNLNSLYGDKYSHDKMRWMV